MEPKVFRVPTYVLGETDIDPNRLRTQMTSKYGRGNFHIKVRPVKLEAGLMAHILVTITACRPIMQRRLELLLSLVPNYLEGLTPSLLV
jgi:hypothetical protein